MNKATKTLVPKLRFPEFRDAGEWKNRKFYDLLEEVLDFRGRTPKKLGMDWGGGNIISLSANNVKNGYIDFDAECNLGSSALYEKWMGKVDLEKNDIVFTMEAPLGNALLVPDSQKYILSQRVVAFKTKKKISNTFLIQLIWSQSFQKKIKRLSTGSTAKGINQKTLKTVHIRTPTEEKEQQKIADCLSSIDELITAHSQKHEALKAHKKGLMQQLFPAEGDDCMDAGGRATQDAKAGTVPKLRFPEFQDAGEWKDKALGSIGEFTGGGTPSKSNEPYWNGTIPWVSSSDISEDSIHQISITRFITKEAIKGSATKLVPSNSILLVSRVGVGKLAISTVPMCTSQDFTSFTPAKDNLMYLAYYLKSHKEVFYSFNQGMAIKGFTKNDVVTLKVSLSLDLKEQQKIADCLSSIDELITAQSQKIEALKAHKKGLMQQLFPAADEVNG